MIAVIVVPCYNEEAILEQTIKKLEDALSHTQHHVIIADNNSTDRTSEIAHAHQSELISYNFVRQKGKGAVIKETWLKYTYDAYAFMDADLATDLQALPQLLQGVEEGYDLVLGSRYIPGAHAERSFKREQISRVYRTLFHLAFTGEITDPQCGFKAISRRVRDTVVPLVTNDEFFFDSELILRVLRESYTFKEIPVTWKEQERSTVKMFRDVPKFLYGLCELKYADMRGKER